MARSEPHRLRRTRSLRRWKGQQPTLSSGREGGARATTPKQQEGRGLLCCPGWCCPSWGLSGRPHCHAATGQGRVCTGAQQAQPLPASVTPCEGWLYQVNARTIAVSARSLGQFRAVQALQGRAATSAAGTLHECRDALHRVGHDNHSPRQCCNARDGPRQVLPNTVDIQCRDTVDGLAPQQVSGGRGGR